MRIFINIGIALMITAVSFIIVLLFLLADKQLENCEKRYSPKIECENKCSFDGF